VTVKVRNSRAVPWLYTVPLLVLVGTVFAYPLAQLVRYSFENVGSSPYLPTTFAGTSNYRFVASDSLFQTAIENNLKLFLCVPILMILSVLLSALIFDRPRGWKVYRWLIFVPYVLSIPVVGIVWGYMFQLNGVVNSGFRFLGIGFIAQDWLGSTSWALPTIMFVVIWRELGFGVILCVARLTSVDEQLFEAARVDGARWWRVQRHVTVPQLAPTLVFYAIVELITMLSWVFAYVYVMTLGGPQNSTVVSEYYIYEAVFQNNTIGVGAAAGVVLLGIVSVLIGVRFWIGRTGSLAYD
jgi:raffinose/stachyose/melibiose transport system permease protein